MVLFLSRKRIEISINTLLLPLHNQLPVAAANEDAGEGPLLGHDQIDDLVLHLRLDAPAQVPGAVDLGIGLLRQVLGGGLGPSEGHPLLRHGGFQLPQQDMGDLGHALLGEMLEADHVVQPVQKLRPQEVLQGVHGLGRWGEHSHYNSDVTVDLAMKMADSFR